MQDQLTALCDDCFEILAPWELPRPAACAEKAFASEGFEVPYQPDPLTAF